MSNSKFSFIRASVGFAGIFAVLILTMPALAADPVFPPGSRIGLVPPGAMVASETFEGFADPGKDAAILITVLPGTAYSQIEKTLDADILKKQGLSLEKREPIKLNAGKGVLLTARQVADKTHYRKWLLVAAASDVTVLITVQAPEQDSTYSDRVVRDALATLSVRPNIPEAEQLGLLPFAVGDLAGFRVDGVLRGRAVMLSDPPGETAKDGAHATFDEAADAHLLIAAVPGGPTELDDHANFARQSFNEIGGIKNVHITVSEPLRIGGQSGFQTMAEATDARNGANVMVVQWLRFGSGGFLQMVGVGRTDSWTSVLARLRTVRDSVELK
jgi:hypothetical protein